MGSRARDRRQARRDARAERKQMRLDARTDRAGIRGETRQTAYESGMDPNATLNTLIETGSGLVSGILDRKANLLRADAGGGTNGGSKSGEDEEPFDFMEWFEDNKTLVLGLGGLVIGTKLLKLW